MGRPARVTREEVLIEARRAFAKGGFEGTTLADIGARLGVSPAALLRHAPSKRALFAEAMDFEPAGQALPTDFLATVASSEDPVRVLRRLAREFVPYVEQRMGESIARFLGARGVKELREVRRLLARRKKAAPAAQVLAAVTDYLRRARSGGALVVRDPRAAAHAFVGSLHSWVFLHRVMGIDPPVPLDTYLETVLDIWKRGAIRK